MLFLLCMHVQWVFTVSVSCAFSVQAGVTLIHGYTLSPVGGGRKAICVARGTMGLWMKRHFAKIRFLS